MQDFMNIQNTYFNQTKNSGQKYRPLPSDLTTKLKLTKTTKGRALTSGIYGSKWVFDIPRAQQNLSQIFIKMTLTSAGNANPASYLATRVFKDIYVQGRASKTILSRIQPLYSLVRYDQLSNTSIQNYLQNCLDPDLAFNNNTVTLFLPLFTFFGDSDSTMLPTRNLEDLEIIAYVNDSATDIALEADLSAIAFDAYFVYYDVVPKDAFRKQEGDNMLWKGPSSYLLRGTYDTWYEDPISVPSGSSEVSCFIRCPEPTFALYFAIKDPTTQDFVPIDRFKIRIGSEDVVDLDSRINFTLSTRDEVAFVDGSVISYWFSQERNRAINSGLGLFTDNYAPAKLTLYFDEILFDAELYVFCEHRTAIRVEKSGRLSREVLGALKLRNADDV